MGELILCRQQIAAMPYYIETVSLNVYSLEEMCYYVQNNLYLMEQDFMEEELCRWVEEELKLEETAQQLREIRETGGTLSEFVLCLLSASGYFNAGELKSIRQTLQEMENKTDFECGKIRADRYMENRRYISAVYEYRKLLREAMGQPEEGKAENPVIAGNMWHNLGTAYARLFLFEKAAGCYSHAYELNHNPNSLKECLFAYRCLRDERGFKRKAAAGFLSEAQAAELAGELTEASRSREIQEFEEEIEEVFAVKEQGQAKAAELLAEWKEEYRRNCRI